MSHKTLSWLSLGASALSLLVSVIVLVNYCPTQDLQFDYMGVIVGILALLVTSLIGAQVGQYVFVDRKIQKITRTLARVISRKVAQEEARGVALDVAKETASESVKKMQEDLRHISTASSFIVETKIAYTLCSDTKYVIKVLNTVEEYLQIDDKELSNTLIDKFLTEQLVLLEKMKANGELKVREEHLPLIEKFLSECDFPHIDKLRGLLLNAETITAEEEPHEISYFRN